MIIPWAKPFIDKFEFNEVKDCFKKQRFTQGKKVEVFEKKMSNIVNSKYCIAVSNGTDALDLAYKALNIGLGDEVIMPAISYISTASAAIYQGATPVFVDVDIKNICINPKKIESAITKKTKAISFIDYGGYPADHDEINKIAKKYKLYIIHDAAQSLGAYYKNKPLGANGTISTMSFHMAKVITTVEGGSLFTNSKKIKDKLFALRNIGEPKNKKYSHIVLGTNSRMTDIQAAFGIAQIDKLKFILKERKKITNYYNEAFKGDDRIQKLEVIKGSKSANFLYPILIKNRDKIAKKLFKDYSIDTRIAYPLPIYDQPMFKNSKILFKKFTCPNAIRVSREILNLPIFPKMKKVELDYVIKSIFNLL
jgi:dTDP-4-amino-4,6-dideoxygalactose transaminase